MKGPRTPNGDLPRSSPPFTDHLVAGHRPTHPVRVRDDGSANGLALVRREATADADDFEQTAGESERDLESVYRRHGARVSRWAARLAGPGFDIEDIVHDVFLVVQRRLKDFRGDARISTWLYEITVRVVQARRRKVLRRRRGWLWAPVLERNAAAAPDAVEPPDPRLSPLDTLERRQATVLLYRFLDELDEKYRTAVVLFELEGVPCPEIAEITGTSISNVWARVSRGREKLIQAFAEWEATEKP
jgi:RNA polymerase sigma-70 factor (ECF subfamily)